MGQADKAGFLRLRTESETNAEAERVTVLILPDGTVQYEGAEAARLTILTAADVEAIVYAILGGLPGEGFILLESGDHLLLESDDELLLE